MDNEFSAYMIHEMAQESGPSSITIPDGVTSIGDKAFSGCSGLTSIVIPDGVTSIGNRAFEGCSNLTSITAPDRLMVHFRNLDE